MEVSIQVHPDDTQRIQLTFNNNEPRTVFLATRRTFTINTQPDGDYFEFEPALDTYQGIQKKRSTYISHELIPIPPHSSVTSAWVELTDLYDIPALGQLKVRYVATHPLEGVGSEMQVIASDWVHIQNSSPSHSQYHPNFSPTNR